MTAANHHIIRLAKQYGAVRQDWVIAVRVESAGEDAAASVVAAAEPSEPTAELLARHV